MPRKTFQLNITGPHGPEDVSITELGQFLVQLERSIVAFTKAEGLEAPGGSYSASG